MDSDQQRRLADGQACFAAALIYAMKGWSVIPLCPPDHVGVGKEHNRTCKQTSWGKVPLIGSWQSRTPATPDEIQYWWRNWPNANIGLAMGIGGLVGIDADGVEGKAALQALISNGSIKTLEFVTPGGGHRCLYVVSKETMLSPHFEALAKKQEVRILGLGSQTVVPPSRHRSGGSYTWASAI